MKKAAAVERNLISKITVLSVAPREEDHAALSGILGSAQWPLCPGSQWTLETTSTLPAALSVLKKNQIPLMICESDLGPATWRELWEQAAALPNPPALIVTSRLADEYLWAEALNLGAYDVLAKPFEPSEVVRTLSQAWLHRTFRRAGQGALTAIAQANRAPGIAV